MSFSAREMIGLRPRLYRHRLDARYQKSHWGIFPIFLYLWMGVSILAAFFVAAQYYYVIIFVDTDLPIQPPPFINPVELTERLLPIGYGIIALGLILVVSRIFFPAVKRFSSLRWLIVWAGIMTITLTLPSVYYPWALVGWYLDFKDITHPVTDQLKWSTPLIGFSMSALGAIAYRAALVRFSKITVRGFKGTAMWGSPKKHVAKSGLIFGWCQRGYIRKDDEGHIITIAATGSNKGVSCVLPNLLDTPQSVLVNDPKGENFAITARYRSQTLGQQVHALDPFGTVREFPVDTVGQQYPVVDFIRGEATGKIEAVLAPLRLALERVQADYEAALARQDVVLAHSLDRRREEAKSLFERKRANLLRGRICFSTWNPMDGVSADFGEVVQDAETLSEVLVEDAASGDNTWIHEARKIIKTFLIYVATNKTGKDRTLYEAYRLMSLAESSLKEMLDGWNSDTTLILAVRQGAAHITSKMKAEGYFASAMGSAHLALSWLDAPPMREVMGSSSLAIEDLRNTPMTLYLVLPADKLDSYRAWYRVMIVSAKNALTRMSESASSRLLFLIDEFAVSGRMGPILSGMALMRGYGVRFWLLIQDLSQLEKRYTEWETLMSNAMYLQAFGIGNDNKTAEWLSKSLGFQAKLVDSTSTGSNVRHGQDIGGGLGHNVGASIREDAVPLLLPDQIRNLHPRTSLLLTKGNLDPLHLHHAIYYRDRLFKGRYDLNPYRLTDKIAALVAERRQKRQTDDRIRRDILVRLEVMQQEFQAKQAVKAAKGGKEVKATTKKEVKAVEQEKVEVIPVGDLFSALHQE